MLGTILLCGGAWEEVTPRHAGAAGPDLAQQSIGDGPVAQPSERFPKRSEATDAESNTRRRVATVSRDAVAGQSAGE